jgi:hypothetical protein
MTKSNDGSRNPSTSIRDQLRVYTNNIGSNPSGRAEGFTPTPPSTLDDWTFDGRRPKIKQECSPDARCGRVTCADCSGPERLRWIRRTLAITKAHSGQHEIATAVIPSIPLAMMDAMFIRSRVLRGVFEKADFQFQSADFQGALLRGGIDNNWSSPWMCAHFLAIGVPREAWARLRALLRNANARYYVYYSERIFPKPSFLLKVEPLRDPEEQIAGLVRFPTYFWTHTSPDDARAASAPADRIEGFTDWASDQTFNDFTFQFGKATTRTSSLQSS